MNRLFDMSRLHQGCGEALNSAYLQLCFVSLQDNEKDGLQQTGRNRYLLSAHRPDDPRYGRETRK
ncbi:hypothetical protein DJ030_01090 [bacterium endosymbiont of Escarpia laminata]|nr:MAG: hypothetical protein DJ031_11065 [bacterium endosymbiont of Escarpia laminata]RLJ22575.1 MAG: hypothetical protein DJ030_01090 [bacterium endosymbiont of Escarpia laminata]